MIARDWSEGDYESVRPPKYIRDYLVTLSRKPRNDRSISTFANAFLALGHDDRFDYRKGQEENPRTR